MSSLCRVEKQRAEDKAVQGSLMYHVRVGNFEFMLGTYVGPCRSGGIEPIFKS